MRQRTIKHSCEISGIGLHSGKAVNVKFHPAQPNRGVTFLLKDDSSYSVIPANINSVSHSQLCTTLTNGLAEVRTVEHLMSAINALGLDNLTIELDSSEFPILGGGSAELYDLLKSANVKKQAALKKVYVVTKEVIVSDGDSYAKMMPASDAIFSFTADFSKRGIAAQTFKFNLSQDSFRNEIAPSRTFGFMSDAEYLRANGLSLGASFDNTLILDEKGPVSPSFYKTDSELARHKILDAIGDLYLIGKRIQGHYVGHKASHRLNTMLAAKLLEENAVIQKAYSRPRRIVKNAFALFTKPATI